MRQLNKKINYESLDTDLTGTFSKEIQQALDKKAHKFLSRLTVKQAGFTSFPRYTNQTTRRIVDKSFMVPRGEIVELQQCSPRELLVARLPRAARLILRIN